MTCRARHRYRGRFHGDGCDADVVPHWHVECRRCRFSWWQPVLFDPKPYAREEAA